MGWENDHTKTPLALNIGAQQTATSPWDAQESLECQFWFVSRLIAANIRAGDVGVTLQKIKQWPSPHTHTRVHIYILYTHTQNIHVHTCIYVHIYKHWIQALSTTAYCIIVTVQLQPHKYLVHAPQIHITSRYKPQLGIPTIDVSTNWVICFTCSKGVSRVDHAETGTEWKLNNTQRHLKKKKKV